MDASIVSRVAPATDAIAPRQAASKSVTPSENPPEKVVARVKDASAVALNEHKQEAAQQQQAETQAEHEKRYELQNKIFVYSVSDAKTGVKVVQFPSEEAVKLRAYLQEQERAKAARKEEAQKERLDIVA